MSEPRFGLPPATVSKIQDVLSHYARVESAVIYGSRAKGNYKNGSDIDLTMYGEDLTFQDLLDISGELDDLLLPYMIDLSIFDTLDHKELKEHIERVGVVFYERSEVPQDA